ncbi:MAG: hypothetical protein H0X51_00205 [Parachlamydiaceae bacterium]|nr:hypothetical protein [Parachlamydiaceae bacterium]
MSSHQTGSVSQSERKANAEIIVDLSQFNEDSTSQTVIETVATSILSEAEPLALAESLSLGGRSSARSAGSVEQLRMSSASSVLQVSEDEKGDRKALAAGEPKRKPRSRKAKVKVAQAPSTQTLKEEDQNKIVAANIPLLIELFNVSKDALPMRCAISETCDFQREFSFLTLGQWVDLAYYALFVKINQTKKSKTAKKGASSEEETTFTIAGMLAKFLTDKTWMDSSLVKHEDKAEILKFLSTLYLDLAKGRGVKETTVEKYEKLLLGIEELAQLCDHACYQKPIQSSSQIDRRFAIVFVNGLIEVLASSMPAICRANKRPLNNLLADLKKVNAQNKQHKSSTGRVLDLDGQKIIQSGKDLEFSVDLEQRLTHVTQMISKPLDILIGKLEEIQKLIPELRTSKDPLLQFAQLKDMLSSGTQLKRLASQNLSTFKNQLLGTVSWFSFVAGIPVPTSAETPFQTCFQAIQQARGDILNNIAKVFEESSKQAFPSKVERDQVISNILSLFIAHLELKSSTNEKESLLKKLSDYQAILQVAGIPLVMQEGWIKCLDKSLLESLKKIMEAGRMLQTTGAPAGRVYPQATDLAENGETRFICATLNHMLDKTAKSKKDSKLDDSQFLTELVQAFREAGAIEIEKGAKAEEFEAFKQNTAVQRQHWLCQKYGERHAKSFREKNFEFFERLVDSSNGVIGLQAAMAMVYGPLFTMLQDIVYALVGDWRDTIDLETGGLLTQKVVLDDAFLDAVDSGAAERKEEAAGKKKKAKSKGKALPKKESSSLSTRTVHVAMPSMLPTFSTGVVHFTPVSKIQLIVMKCWDMGDEVALVERLGTRGRQRHQYAQDDYLFALKLVDRVTDMMQRLKQPYNADGTLHPVASILVAFGSLQASNAAEQKATHELLERNPALLSDKTKFLKHSIPFMRSMNSRSSKGHQLALQVPQETLEYRYPRQQNNPQRELMLFKLWPELMQDLADVSCEALPAGSYDDALRKELLALGETFGKRAAETGSLSADQIHRLLQAEKELQSTIEGLQKILKGALPRENRETLIRLLKHLSTLKFVPACVMEFPNQRDLAVSAMILFSSVQCAVEHLGLCCGLNAGETNMVRVMGDSVHSLATYCESFGLAEPLNEKTSQYVHMHDVGKLFEYPFYASSCALPESEEFYQMFKEILKGSFSPHDAKGILASSSSTKKDLELAYAKYQERFIQHLVGSYSMINALVQHHVFFEGD